MTVTNNQADTNRAPSDMTSQEFRDAGYRLVDALAEFYESLPNRPVTLSESVSQLEEIFATSGLPQEGRSAGELLNEVVPLLLDHSLHNGHPRFFGYITSSAAPIGALADLLAAAINQNCGLRQLAPAANVVEQQVVAWLAELVGYPTSCGGLMVSGGNVANILGFVAARRARLSGDVRRDGVDALPGRPRVYCSRDTHTWIEKAVDVTGLGTTAIRWIDSDRDLGMNVEALTDAIEQDRRAGDRPFLAVATAGQVSTGAIDPLEEIADIANRHGLWFHVDGAYGAPAACLPEAPESLKALALADSVALDPHKWLYVPIEAACTLVRDPDSLRRAFSYRPPYYRLDDEADQGGLDYFEHGLQNTRAFRALKVWLCLRQAGRAGYERAIRDNIALAGRLYQRAQSEENIEAGTHHLSITTLRYRPKDTRNTQGSVERLNRLNERLLAELQRSGEAYVSNALLDGNYFLRACIVNFRTRAADIDALIDTILRLGRSLDGTERQR